MKYLDKYVQVSQEGRPYPILCHGDQLSMERMIDAKLSMAFSEDEADQLRGLIPSPGIPQKVHCTTRFHEQTFQWKHSRG